MIIQQYKSLLISCLIIFLSSCTPAKEKQYQERNSTDTLITKATSTRAPIPTKSHKAMKLDSLGFIEIPTIDSTILIKLMYTQPDNFTGQILYDDLKEAYLHPNAAKALVRAHKALKKRHPSYHFIIYDAARPMSVQKKMWDKVKGTSKNIYVSNPAHGGGLHNYGLAVDISIAESSGNPLPMGTEVDYLGPEAHITQESELVRRGRISEQEMQNRLLLRQVMREGGFRSLPSEWWHFNFCSRETARKEYKLIP